MSNNAAELCGMNMTVSVEKHIALKPLPEARLALMSHPTLIDRLQETAMNT